MNFLLLFMVIKLNSADLPGCRKMLDQSVDDKARALLFYEKMKQVSVSDNPVMVGFRAMSEFMQSKHLLNPLRKLSHFNRGRELLEAAINREPASPELIFFRFSTQSNAPALLGYSGQLRGDKGLLIRYLKAHCVYPSGDGELYVKIKAYLLLNPYCSAEEKVLLKTL